MFAAQESIRTGLQIDVAGLRDDLMRDPEEPALDAETGAPEVQAGAV
jgi:hypothetical protein